jgi:hypothetical protein
VENGAVECEHCSRGRTSRPFTGYNHRKWFKSVSGMLEGGALRWTSTAEEVSDIAVARGSVFGLAKGDLEDRGDVVDPMFQSEGGELYHYSKIGTLLVALSSLSAREHELFGRKSTQFGRSGYFTY